MGHAISTIGQTATLRSSSGLALGEISVIGVEDGIHVIARLSLAAASADAVEHHLLRDLAEACEYLAFAVIEERERDLRRLGLYLDLGDDLSQLQLGSDFSGIVVTDECKQISFRMLNLSDERSEG